MIMDPTETLRLLCELAHDVRTRTDAADAAGIAMSDLTEEAENFATLFRSLDEWIRGGGFLPDQWAPGRRIVCRNTLKPDTE